MKKLVLVISLIIIVLSVKAQNGEYHVRIHGQESKGIILDAPVSSIDSIFVNPAANNPIKVRTTNNLYSFDFTEVDSLTFPFIPASTGDIVYINYNGTTAEVTNPYPTSEVNITVSEAKVSVTSLSSENITFILSGTANPGRFAIESTTTPTIRLNGVSLTNPTGKAMDLTCDTGIILEFADGTTNSLSDGIGSDKKAALMSNSDLLVQGNGTLNVTSLVKHPIKVKGICTINSGNFVITSDVDDVNGLSADSTLVINGGSFDITMNGDISKCIKCDDNMTVNGGEFTIVASGTTVLETVNSQQVPSYCSAIKCDGNININGGTFSITLPTTNHGGKGISCDGTLDISGGDFNITTEGAGAGYTVSGNTKDSYTSACLRSDGNTTITGGTFTLTSTGAGGKGINVGATSLYSTLHIGTANGNDDDLILNVATSGERITVTGGGWGGGNSMVMLFTDPQLQTGQTYTIKYNGTISGGTNWNGYYTGNVTYSGGSTTTATLNSMYTTVSAGGSGW